jgi:hypothetical protein
MAVTKAITGNAYKHNNGTVFHGGNVNTTTGPLQKNLSIADSTYAPYYGSHVNLGDGSVLESGTVGTQKAISGGNFASMEQGAYVAKILGTKVAGITNTILRSGASHTNTRVPFNYAKGTRRYHITAWSYTTGAATKGGSAGGRINYYDPETGNTQAVEPYPTKAVPGRLVYMVTGKTATTDTYQAQNG